jgi:hypothetical protein
MAEDWRLTVSLAGGASGERLGAALHELELEHEARAALGDRIAVSTSSEGLVLYADTREAAEQAKTVLAGLLEGEEHAAGFTLERWHPVAEEWEAADAELPATPEQLERERALLDAKDAADSSATGYAEWEVRLDLPAHRDAVALAQRLESEGVPVTRRWRYLLIGAQSRDDAAVLAERLQAEAPAGARLQIQAGGEMTWETAPRRPFALFFLPS